MAAVLYTWNLAPAEFRPICDALAVRLRPVAPHEAGIPLGKLPESPAPSLPAAVPFPEEMLVMAGFTETQTDRFLAVLRQRHPVRLKAVLTPFNAAWTGTRLREELLREDRSFHPA